MMCCNSCIYAEFITGLSYTPPPPPVKDQQDTFRLALTHREFEDLI